MSLLHWWEAFPSWPKRWLWFKLELAWDGASGEKAVLQCRAASSGLCPTGRAEGCACSALSGLFILKCKWVLTGEHNNHGTALLPHIHPTFCAWLSALTNWHMQRLLGSTPTQNPFLVESRCVDGVSSPLTSSCSMADLTRDWDQFLGDSRMVMRPSFPHLVWSLCPKHPLH